MTKFAKSFKPLLTDKEPLDLSALAQAGGRDVVLQIVQDLNHEGKYHEALFAAEALDPDLPTTRLEQAHAFISIGHFDHIEKHLESVFQDPALNLNRLFLASKYVGYAQMMHGDFKKAKQSLNTAMEYAYLNHDFFNKTEAVILLARVHAYCFEFKECEALLGFILKEKPDLHFTKFAAEYNYAISHFFYLQGDPRCFQFNEFARSSLQDSRLLVSEYKYQMESKLMQKFALLDYDSEYENRCRAYAETSSSDLKNWVGAILDQGPAHNAVLRILLNK